MTQRERWQALRQWQDDLESALGAAEYERLQRHLHRTDGEYRALSEQFAAARTLRDSSAADLLERLLDIEAAAQLTTILDPLAAQEPTASDRAWIDRQARLQLGNALGETKRLGATEDDETLSRGEP